MLLTVVPGVQTTVQAGPRAGRRHMGVPSAGAADPLSAALANRLVGNAPDAPFLEITFGAWTGRFLVNATIAVTGAVGELHIDGQGASPHETHVVPAGVTVSIGHPSAGARAYLAVRGGLGAQMALGSASTYLPARLGGHEGRALKAGDRIAILPSGGTPEMLRTPPALRPFIGRHWVLRLLPAAETALLARGEWPRLNAVPFTVGRRADRMGLALEGPMLKVASEGTIPSAPVFPGTIQCPEGGRPYILLADAQTTGGYPRIAQIARADRHRLGQMRPGDTVAFAVITPDEAVDLLREKRSALAPFLSEPPF